MSQPKVSLFAQRMQKQRQRKKQRIEASPNTTVDQSILFGDRSYVVSGSAASVIHQENIEKLSMMSTEEIETERERLLHELDPSVIQFLRRKRQLVSGDNNSQASCSMDASQPNPEPNINVTEIEDVKEFANKYPHMNVVEHEKLQWIGELEKPQPPPSNKAYNARFDFEGKLLPYADEGEGVLKGLHNHGEEQSRPGYTLQELIQLSRSSVLQQRVIALNTLSNVLANASSYDKYLEEPMLPALLDADIYLLLRFSLDDPAQPVVMASSMAMANLIFNLMDETCLDLMLGLPQGIQQPSLGVTINMKPADIAELKDQELLKLDLVKGTLRTELLPRIRYILEMLHPEPVEIKHLLKMLTRIVRHSYETTEAVFMCPGLLNVVRSLLDTLRSSYFPEALKLFRVIICRSHSLALNVLEKFDILTPIFRIISGERAQGHPELLHLTLEAFYTWQSLLSYNIATETIGLLNPVLMRLLEAHFALTSLTSCGSDLEHATAMFSIFIAGAKLGLDCVGHALPLAHRATTKWTTQLFSSQQITFPSAKTAGAALRLMALSHANFNSGDLGDIVGKFLRSSCFSNAAQKLRRYSWLLSGDLGLSPENHPCLGSIPPTLHFESILPLFQGLASYILASRDPPLIRLFINNVELLGYIEDVLRKDDINKLCGHWYARQEINLLVEIVHLNILVQVEGTQELFHRLSFLLVTLVQAGDKYLLPEIVFKAIFNSTYFRGNEESIAERMKGLSVTEMSSCDETWIARRKLLNEALADFEKIELCYSRELGLTDFEPRSHPVTLTGLLNSTQPTLPADWPFLPILRIYDTQGTGKDSVEVTTRSLQWILLLEELNCKINTSVTAKYCRLSCVFLAGNDLFRELTPLLECTLQSILRNNIELDFDTPIPGLTSFYDFYRQLLEQFAGVSYCDPVFGQYILVPLQQKHNPKYKKLLWSEQAAILRLLATPTDKVNMEDHLVPCETDPDLLMTYLYCLATGRVCKLWAPVLFTVAVHHTATFIHNFDDSNVVRKRLMDRVLKLGNKDLRDMLLNYSRGC